MILLFSVSAFNHLSLSALKAEGTNPNLALFTDAASLMEKSFSFLFVILLFLPIIPRIALAVRRLRDTARSTLWLLLVFVPFGSLVLWIWFMGPTKDVNYGGM